MRWRQGESEEGAPQVFLPLEFVPRKVDVTQNQGPLWMVAYRGLNGFRFQKSLYGGYWENLNGSYISFEASLE